MYMYILSELLHKWSKSLLRNKCLCGDILICVYLFFLVSFSRMLLYSMKYTIREAWFLHRKWSPIGPEMTSKWVK